MEEKMNKKEKKKKINWGDNILGFTLEKDKENTTIREKRRELGHKQGKQGAQDIGSNASFLLLLCHICTSFNPIPSCS